MRVSGLYGWRGSEGTDPVLMKAFDDIESRDECLTIAAGRLLAEGLEYRGQLFRGILSKVVAEQKGATNGARRGGGRELADLVEKYRHESQTSGA